VKHGCRYMFPEYRIGFLSAISGQLLSAVRMLLRWDLILQWIPVDEKVY
jgi:hypothetical protein